MLLWPRCTSTQTCTFTISNEASKRPFKAKKKLDLDSKTLISSKLGIFIIFHSNVNEFWGFHHTNSNVGAVFAKVARTIEGRL